MPPAGYFIDANLLVLLIVGSVDKRLIAKHRRLRGYSATDYETLIRLLPPVEQVFVTPNTLTETSDLLAQHACDDHGLPPLIARHDPPHEFVEHRHGKGSVSMTRTPDHAFVEQLTANGGQGGHLAA